MTCTITIRMSAYKTPGTTPPALSAQSSQSLRHLSRIGDGITARVFGILNELAIEAIQDGKERISDENIESWKPALEKEAAFA